MAYAESLFLVLVLGAFLAAERGRVLLAGVLLALATLTRLQGAVLIIPLAWILWENAGRPRSIGASSLVARAPARAAAAPAAPSLWVVWLTGDSARTRRRRAPGAGVGLGGDATGVARRRASHRPRDRGTSTWSTSPCCMGAVFLFVFVRVDRIPLPYAAVPALFLAMVFLQRQHPVDRAADPARVPERLDPRGRRGSLAGGTCWPAASVLLLFVLDP